MQVPDGRGQGVQSGERRVARRHSRSGRSLPGDSAGGRAASPTPPKPATPASEGLRLSVEGLSNPVRIGKGLTYEIVVENKGTASCRQVSVTATVPDGMVPATLGTNGPGGAAAVKVDRQMVRFDPVPEVPRRKRRPCRNWKSFRIVPVIATSGSGIPGAAPRITPALKGTPDRFP